MYDDVVVIDGSHGEGGGQIIRTALAMSAVTGKGFRMENIRANRPKPGLAHQHLTGLMAAAEVCGAEVHGNGLGSTSFTFLPGGVRHGDYEFEVGTAGSVTLVLQALMPALASREGASSIRVRGGTDVRWAPPVDFYRLVLFPVLEYFGCGCSMDIHRRGYYPRGGGEVVMTLASRGAGSRVSIGSLTNPESIKGLVNITGLPVKIAEHVRGSVEQNLPERLRSILDIHIEHGNAGPSQGVGVVLSATDGYAFLGASALGERGKPAEKVGKEAAYNLVRELDSEAGVDVHAADQLLPFLALSATGSHYMMGERSRHFDTNVWTVQKFLGETFDVGPGRVTRK